MGQIREIINYANKLFHKNNQIFKTQIEDFDI